MAKNTPNAGWAVLTVFLVIFVVVVSPTLAATATGPSDDHPIAMGTPACPDKTAATVSGIDGGGVLTIRGYADALTADEVDRALGGVRTGAPLGVPIGGDADARVVAIGLHPTGDEFIGIAYADDDAELVAVLAHAWDDVGTLASYCATEYPYAAAETGAGSHRGVRKVTHVSVRQPYGAVVTTHRLTHLDGDTTADVYAVQSQVRLIPGAHLWAGSGYVTVATDVTHAWADGGRANTVLDFVQPGDLLDGPTDIVGTYHPSTRANLTYNYRQSNLTTYYTASPTTVARWTATTPPASTAGVVGADDLTPLSVATVRHGYTDIIATISSKTRFHTMPFQPGGITLIDESTITSSLEFQQVKCL
jgi:hypothetical protein